MSGRKHQSQSATEAQHELERENTQLRAENERLRKQITEKERESERLKQEIEGLKQEIEGLKDELRAKSRQAAPFSKGWRKANPKRPGRKAGQGTFRHRAAPPRQESDQVVAAGAPAQCPPCRGGLSATEKAEL